MKHRHHIIPRHAGGTDDPSNLVYLTIEEHALAHKVLYEQYGREQDRIAWLALSKQADKGDIILACLKLGQYMADLTMKTLHGDDYRKTVFRNASARGAKKLKDLYENNKEFRQNHQKNQKNASNAALSENSRKKD